MHFQPSSSTTTKRSGSLEEQLHQLLLARVPVDGPKHLAELHRRPQPCRRDRGAASLPSRGRDSFDKVVVITAPKQLRRARSVVATEEREARLIPDEEKVLRADYAYRNPARSRSWTPSSRP